MAKSEQEHKAQKGRVLQGLTVGKIWKEERNADITGGNGGGWALRGEEEGTAESLATRSRDPGCSWLSVKTLDLQRVTSQETHHTEKTMN